MAFKKNILTIDFDEAELTGTNYDFPYNLYNSVSVATGAFAINFGNDVFTPVRAVTGNGYYQITFYGTNTAYYVTKANPTLLTTTVPT